MVTHWLHCAWAGAAARDWLRLALRLALGLGLRLSGHILEAGGA